MKQALCGAAAALLLAAPAVAAPTTNYAWEKPTIGSDDNEWGEKLNQTTDAIDAQVKTVEDIARGVSAADNPSAWQKYSSGNIGTSSGTVGFLLPAGCRGIKIFLQGILPSVANVPLTARIAYDQVPNVSTTSSYSSAWVYSKTDGTSAGSGNSGQTSFTISPVNLGSSPHLISGFEINMLNPVGQLLLFWDGMFLDYLGNYVMVRGGGRYSGLSAAAYIEFILGSGVFSAGGTYAVYCSPHL